MGALGVVQYMAGDAESSPKQQWRWLCATFFRKLKRYRMQNERKETHILRNETKCIRTPYRKCNLIERKGLHFCQNCTVDARAQCGQILYVYA